jgi:hypothetical protein
MIRPWPLLALILLADGSQRLTIRLACIDCPRDRPGPLWGRFP